MRSVRTLCNVATDNRRFFLLTVLISQGLWLHEKGLDKVKFFCSYRISFNCKSHFIHISRRRSVILDFSMNPLQTRDENKFQSTSRSTAYIIVGFYLVFVISKPFLMSHLVERVESLSV